jgi:hypothetical protein
MLADRSTPTISSANNNVVTGDCFAHLRHPALVLPVRAPVVIAGDHSETRMPATIRLSGQATIRTDYQDRHKTPEATIDNQDRHNTPENAELTSFDRKQS